ncbi:MAG: hypothetical protein IJB86_01425 [Clostridia bacterium]|nr:hypothetical protein [Clostridia bacterium]
MTNDIFNGFMLAFFVLASFTVIYELVLQVLRPEKDERYVIVVYISTYTPDVCDRLYSHLMRIDLRGESENACVIAVDTGMSETERRLCREFCTSTKNIYLCDPQGLSVLIAEFQKDSKNGLSAE